MIIAKVIAFWLLIGCICAVAFARPGEKEMPTPMKVFGWPIILVLVLLVLAYRALRWFFTGSVAPASAPEADTPPGLAGTDGGHPASRVN